MRCKNVTGQIILCTYVLCFNFIRDLNFISVCFSLIIKHYLPDQKTKIEIKFNRRIKLNHNI